GRKPVVHEYSVYSERVRTVTIVPYTTLCRACRAGHGIRQHLAAEPSVGSVAGAGHRDAHEPIGAYRAGAGSSRATAAHRRRGTRSEEHTSELQSREKLVCRFLQEKKHYIA